MGVFTPLPQGLQACYEPMLTIMNDSAGYARTTLSVSPPELLEWARERAARERRSLSAFVSDLLETAQERERRAEARRVERRKEK